MSADGWAMLYLAVLWLGCGCCTAIGFAVADGLTPKHTPMTFGMVAACVATGPVIPVVGLVALAVVGPPWLLARVAFALSRWVSGRLRGASDHA